MQFGIENSVSEFPFILILIYLQLNSIVKRIEFGLKWFLSQQRIDNHKKKQQQQQQQKEESCFLTL
jgi:hypothetical protein